MSFWRDRVLPGLLDLAMRQETLVPYRARAAGAASGRVLEVGIGSGLNLPFYGSAVRAVIGLDPSARLLEMTAHRARERSLPLSLIGGSADAMPLEDGSVDSVLVTWTLCSVPDAGRALGEIRRVLRPGGALILCEHGRAPDQGVAAWQRRLAPAWRPLAGGCRLDRDPKEELARAGFATGGLRQGYMAGVPRLLGFMSEGLARR